MNPNKEAYRSSTVAIPGGAISTIPFPSEQLPKGGIVAFHFDLTGAGNQFSTCADRLRVSTPAGFTVDFTAAQWRAYMSRMSRSNQLIAIADTRFSLLFYLPDEKGNRRYEQQLEPGTVQVELTTTAGSVAGTARISWTTTQVKPKMFFRNVRRGAGVNINENKRTIDQGVAQYVRAFILPTTGLTEFIVRHPQLADFAIFNSASIIQAQQAENNWTGTPLTDPIAYKFNEPITGSDLKLEFTTGAAWVAANEVNLVGYVLPEAA
jgi:hypothetical protein